MLRRAPILLVFLAACSGPAEEPAADLEPLPVPAHLGEVDAPVRAQYDERRAVLDRLLASPDAAAAEIAEAYGSLGMWHHAYGDLELARLAYRLAESHARDEARWPCYLGRILADLGKTGEARARLRVCLERRPGDPSTRVHLGELELEAGRGDAARPYFAAALDADPESARALAGLGRLALQERDFEAAAGYLERALALQPEATTLAYNLGLAWRGKGDRDQAAAYMARAQRDNRNKSGAVLNDPLMAAVNALDLGASGHTSEGRRAFYEGRYDEAVAAAEAAVEVTPDQPAHHLNLGAALLRAGRTEEAVAAFEKALEVSPAYAMAHFNLGTALYQLGRRDEAEEQYRAAVRANPGFKEARFNLANLLRFRGDCAAALEEYRKVAELDPALSHARLWRSVCLAALGRHGEALAWVERDLADLPGAPELAVLRIRLLAAAPEAGARDGRRAVALAEDLVRRWPTVAAAEALAAAHAEAGDFDAAAAAQARALAAAPASAAGGADARLARRLALYRRGEPCREVWADDELRGASAPLGPGKAPGAGPGR